MTLSSPIRLDRFERAVKDVLEDATGIQVAWAYGQGVYSSTFGGSFVNLTVSGGPSFPITAGRGVTGYPAESIAYTVDSATVGTLVAVTVNEVPYRHEVESGDTVDTIRDDLVSLITADASGEYTAAAGGGAGEWTLTPVAFGSIWQFDCLGDMTQDPEFSTDLAIMTQGKAQVSVQVEAYSKSRTPRAGAWSIATKLAAALQLPETSLTLRDYGVGIGTIGDLTDLSAIAGGNWESRVAFDVEFNLQFTVVRPVDQISTITVNTSGASPSLTTSVEVSQ